MCIANDKYCGTCTNESGSIVMDIQGDTLIMKSYESDTLAICNWQRVSDTFMEINSIVNPVVNAFKDMSIHRSKLPNDTSNTPAIFRFVLPNTTDDLEIYVLCGTKSYKGLIHNGVSQITLNNYRSRRFPEPISFGIRPIIYVESNPQSQYFGLLYLSYPFDIKYELNDLITIELPSVTPDLFNQYFIKGEYVHIVDEGLEWRGDTYYKQK